MKLIIGADHRGAEAASRVAERLITLGHQVRTVSPPPGEACDYPEPAYDVGQAISRGECQMGVLICGTGVGMCMAANKIDGVRAANVHDEITAELSRSHNNANIICLSADLLGPRLIDKVVEVFLATPFAGGRHDRRLQKIAAIEQGRDPRSA
jgi:ribose 5-phosphate isomerase B